MLLACDVMLPKSNLCHKFGARHIRNANLYRGIRATLKADISPQGGAAFTQIY